MSTLMNMPEREFERALGAQLKVDGASVRLSRDPWDAVAPQMGSQRSRWPWESVMDAITKPRMPFKPQYMYTAGAALVVVIAALLLLVFLNTNDGVEGESVPADTPEQIAPDADAEPAGGIPAPGPTPIAALDVPDDLVPFEELGRVLIGAPLHGNNMRLLTQVGPISSASGLDATPTAGEILRREDLWRSKFAERRLKLLVFTTGVDPFDEEDSPLSADDEGVIAVVSEHLDSELYFSVDNERLYVLEFAMCGDGRGVYLEMTTTPVKVGETFAYEIYVNGDDTIGDFHTVWIAEPDSPITYDPPDPKRFDIKWTPVNDVLTADTGLAIVGIFAEGGPAVKEMCS